MTAALDPVTRRTLATSILIGACALLVLGVHPILLGAMVEEGRIAEAQVGNLVTIEMIAIVVGSLAGIWLLRKMGPRVVVGGTAIALTAINLFMTELSGMAVIATCRGLAGLSEGVLVASTLVAISRVARVERASAIFLAVQTLMQAIAAASLPFMALGSSRTGTALLVLAFVGGIATLCALALPRELRPAPSNGEHGALTPASLAALVGAGLFLGAIVSVWSYFGLWLLGNGYPPTFEGTAISLCLVAQVVGALTAAQFGERLPNRRTIIACALAAAVSAMLFLMVGDDSVAILAVSVAFGFFWLFTLPFFAGWLIEIDPSRRAVLYITAFQLGGAALMPSLAGIAVGRFSVDAAMVFSAGVFLVLAALAFLNRASHPSDRPC
ncbi:MFS transporter [Alteriqipengyuania sp. 357]